MRALRIAPGAASSAALSALLGSLAAQQTIVSPAPASATVDGSQSNAFPWNATTICRLMQVHSDIGGTPKTITRIAHRRDGGRGGAGPGGSRTVDIELRMGDSVPYDRISYVFARNWIGTPTQVLPRQTLNIGPLLASGTPAPFELVVPLATPFAYSGVRSLAWEVVVHANKSSGSFSQLDAESGSSGNSSTPLSTGPGCTAAGLASPMTLTVEHVERGGTYQFGAAIEHAPANAPTVFYLGSQNPDLAVPGLCGNLYTDLLLPIATAVTDGTGALREYGPTTTVPYYPSALFTFVLPNRYGGTTLYGQAHALDAARSDPLQVCNSNGVSWNVPLPSTTTVAMVSRLYNFQVQGPSHPHATPVTQAHAFGAVTEFTY